MQDRLIELHQRRGRLLERIAAQRQTLARELVPLQGVFNAGERARRAAQDGKNFLLQHPLVLGVALTALVVFKPRTVLRWAQRGLSVWRTWRSVYTLVPGFLLRQLRGLL